jgi:SAM-dependent methyltransferase
MRSPVMTERTEANEGLASYIDAVSRSKSARKVLDAGCGSSSKISLGSNVHLAGLDISQKQLDRNEALDERILGDLQCFALPPQEFDFVVCWDVLEHLRHPRAALENLVNTTKDDGVLIFGGPNVVSMKSLIAKFTPHWFHVWIYRALTGDRRFGTEDHGPFKTFLRFSIAPTALARFADKKGLSIEYFVAYESPAQKTLRERIGLAGRSWRFAKAAIRVLTLGRVHLDQTDLILVLRKTPEHGEKRCGSE